MSETATTTEHAAAETPAESPFSRDELEQFDRDDVLAGGAIGKMLALFFLYTVIVMAAVGVLTFSGWMD